jgi:hypothetical protein
MKVNIGPYPKGHLTARRIDIQIDKYDTWNMYTTLALIIYPMLIQLKETKHGVPSEFADIGGADHDMQDSFDFYKESHNESFDESCKRWEEILDKMIWSFEQLVNDDYDGKYHHGEAKYEFVDTEPMLNPTTGKMEVMHRMVDTNPDEHWYDLVGHRLHDDRIQEGLDLFGKYFRNLWD